MLIAVTYLLIVLHERDYRLIIQLWKPFRRIFIRFKRQWNFKTSIIDAFATFITLSYVKLLSVSFDILVPTGVYNVKGEFIKFYLYYDSSIEYLGKEHRPFACLAIFVLTVTAIFPVTLLLLYPMLCFQKCLNRCNLNREGLRVFMECFQGFYQNRTDKGREYRYLEALFYVLRSLVFVFYAITLSSISYALSCLFFTLLGATFLILPPYKAKFSIFNKVEGSMLILLAVCNGGMVLFNLAVVKGIVVVVFASIIPHVYISILTLHWLYSRKCILEGFLKKGFYQPREPTLNNSMKTTDNEKDRLIPSINF